MIFWLEDHLVIRGVGNRSARGQGRHAGTPPAAEHVVDAIVVDQRPAAAAAGTEPFRQHAQRRRKIFLSTAFATLSVVRRRSRRL